MTAVEQSPNDGDPRVEKFRGRWPSEDESLPDPEFYDADGLLPMTPEGAIVILYGDSGSHKTNVAIALVMDAIFDRGARVCYAAGEGAYGVRKKRIPAHCRARGITTAHLTGRFRVSPAVPLLAQGDEVNAFIEAQADLLPDIVVLDTLATATAGQDENAAITAAMLTANGPVGKIRQDLEALVLVLAHSGKNAERGVRGHSGFKGNADAVLRVTADKEAGTIEIFVEKMRDGRDQFSIYFAIETPLPGAFAGVPIPRKITDTEYNARLAHGSKGKEAAQTQARYDRLREPLIAHGAFGFENGLQERDFARILVGPPPDRDTNPATLASREAEYDTAVETELKWLKNRHDKLAYSGFCGQQVPIGGKRLQWRWFVPKPDASAAG